MSTSSTGLDRVGRDLSATDDLFLHTRHPDSVARTQSYRTTHVEQYSSRRQLIYSNCSDVFLQAFGDRLQDESDTDDTITLADGHRNLARSSYRQQDEFRWSKAWHSIDGVLKYMYLLFINVLLLDTWLLSRAEPVRARLPNRRTKLFWIALLPLLLLGGLWLLAFLFLNLGSTLALVIHPLTLLSSPPEVSQTHNYGWEEEVVAKAVKMDKINEQKQKEQDSIISSLLFKVKKLENTILSQNDKLAKIASNAKHIGAIELEMQSLRESCSDRTPALPLVEINKHVNDILAGYSGSKNLDLDPAGRVISESDVRNIVTNALKIYDADKTGRADYALESAGGLILSTRCTQQYNLDTRAYVFGYVPFSQNSPRTVIQGNPVQPGKCWGFQDFPGYLLIKLRTVIHVTGFTVEHAPKSILPNGDMRSAPRKFDVWGYNHEYDEDPVLFGEYEFSDSDESLQYFPIQNTISKPYDMVELRIHSNQGLIHYTSLYRFRVHGSVA